VGTSNLAQSISPLILSGIHHVQNPLESTASICLEHYIFLHILVQLHHIKQAFKQCEREIFYLLFTEVLNVRSLPEIDVFSCSKVIKIGSE
jgi:hypothetical protein